SIPESVRSPEFSTSPARQVTSCWIKLSARLIAKFPNCNFGATACSAGPNGKRACVGEDERAGPRKNNKYTAARLNKVATATIAGCRKIPPDSFSGSGNGDSNRSCIFFPILAAQRQPENKRFRQVGFIHSRLHRRNIVRYAPEFHDFVIEIGNCKSGAGIAVARLSDGAGTE